MNEGSNKRCKLAQRFLHGSVRTKIVNRNKETIVVDIENFMNVPHQKWLFNAVEINNIQVCDHQWILEFRPGVVTSHAGRRGRCIKISLYYDGERTEVNPVIVNARFRSKTTAIESFREKHRCFKNDQVFIRGCGSVLLQRQKVFGNDLNEDGTFTFEIDIEVTTATAKRAVWYPELSTSNNVIATKLYRSIEATFDVTFLVGQQKKEIKAHKIVLAVQARDLYDLVITEEQSSPASRNGTEIILTNADANAFEALVQFCYIGTIPQLNTESSDDKNETKTKNVLLVADRFGCKDLKLYIESYIVEYILLPSKAARLLLLADSHSCPLLKEASMNAFVADPKTVMESQDDWKNIQESTKLLEELLVHATSDRSNTKCSSNYEDGLDVTSLRKDLQTYQIDVDGSKEMLLQRWKDHSDSGVFS